MPARRPRLSSVATGELIEAFAALDRGLDLPTAFPDTALAEAESAARTVSVDPDAANLADLRGVEFLTIDPIGSRDLDQALHLERTASGAVLHYAIADIPAFVEPGGALDAEARRRGQTLYAADRRIPLHPDVLGEDAASLLPDADRRAFVWRFELDEGARPVTTSLTRAVIRSRRRWSYPEAQRAVEHDDAPESLRALPWFGAERTERERERGGASLNVPEVEIAASDGGYRLVRRSTLPIEEWNAQVSLLTGMAAADIMLRGGVGILRTMPAAEADDISAFRAQTVALGIPWPEDESYGDYLRGLDSAAPAALAVRDAAATLFRGAGYVAFDGTPPASPEQAAVGAPYAHTTAPIRRLVDRWSLVVCEALANGRDVPAWARGSLAELPKLMGRSDNLANRLEAASVDRVEAALLHDRVGDVFRGVVLRLREGRARVQLDHPAVTVSFAAPEGVAAGQAITVRIDRADIATGAVEISAA